MQTSDKKKVDKKEFEIPETLFVRDIENRVFVSIVLQCLSEISGIGLVEGNVFDHLLGRSSEGVKGLQAEQDAKSQSVKIKVEVNITYGISIPEKAEEIQTKIAEKITELTGLHVGAVHVVFKNVLSPQEMLNSVASSETPATQRTMKEEYSDDF